MRRRGSRRRPLSANPFVVFADLTIALAFIAAVHGFTSMAASSQALAVMGRAERQAAMVDSVVGTVKANAFGSTLKGERGKYYTLSDSAGAPILQVYQNANFVRIMLMMPVWTSRSARLDAEKGAKFYALLARLLRPYAENFGYLYTHGIVEPQEGLSDSDATQLSRQRADVVFDILMKSHLVGRDPNSESSTDKAGEGWVPRKYAVSFGTGQILYTSPMDVGRVDILLFFTDDDVQQPGTKSAVNP